VLNANRNGALQTLYVYTLMSAYILCKFDIYCMDNAVDLF